MVKILNDKTQDGLFMTVVGALLGSLVLTAAVGIQYAYDECTLDRTFMEGVTGADDTVMAMAVQQPVSVALPVANMDEGTQFIINSSLWQPRTTAAGIWRLTRDNSIQCFWRGHKCRSPSRYGDSLEIAATNLGTRIDQYRADDTVFIYRADKLGISRATRIIDYRGGRLYYWAGLDRFFLF